MFAQTPPGPVLAEDVVEYASRLAPRFELYSETDLQRSSLQTAEKIAQLFKFGSVSAPEEERVEDRVAESESTITQMKETLWNVLYTRCCIVREFASLQQYIVWCTWVTWWVAFHTLIPQP
uniref:Uncharacterized protein n=1 Tax=Lygus hesperus TaxID=30085 RepID=A0A146M9Z7_LYGHE